MKLNPLSWLRKAKPPESDILEIPPRDQIITLVSAPPKGSTLRTLLSAGLIAAIVFTQPAVKNWISETLPGMDTLELVHLDGERGSDNKILALRIDGVILGTSQGSLLTTTTNGYVVHQILKRAAKQDEIKAVVVRLSTPGGTVYGAVAIHDALREYSKATGKPVIAHVEGIAASGGVYAMVGADEIYAEPGSLTGSIGVTMGTLTYYDQPTSISGGLLSGGVETKGGIKTYPLSAGKGKLFGSTFHQPTEEELSIIQSGLELEYDRFIEHVAEARHIEPEVIRDQMGAYVFSNDKAQEFGLIDGTLTRQGVIDYVAGDKLGLGDDYEVVQVNNDPPGLLAALSAKFGTTPVTADSAGCVGAISAVMAYHGDMQSLCR